MRRALTAARPPDPKKKKNNVQQAEASQTGTTRYRAGSYSTESEGRYPDQKEWAPIYAEKAKQNGLHTEGGAGRRTLSLKTFKNLSSGGLASKARSADSNSAEAAKESQDHLPVPTSLAKSDITDRIGESEAA